MKKTILSLALGLFLSLAIIVLVSENAKGAGNSNTIAYVATSSTITVGPQQVKTLFAQFNFCQNSIVSTVSQPIMISFSSTITPSQFIGFQVGASTTQAFPAELYGCGAITASAAASTTITITRFIQ